jgi:hypothetical protein
MSDLIFNISVINAAMEIRLHQKNNPEYTIEQTIRVLRYGPATIAAFDYGRAQFLGEAIGWEVFQIVGTRHEQLQETLYRIIIHLRPFWAKIAYLGRKKVLQIISDDHRQCLSFAGLLDDGIEEEVILWWDKISFFFRTVEEERKLQIGRAGELRTLEYEELRLSSEGINRKPIWISREDNTAGYDVISFINNQNDIRELYIEVKTCVNSELHFYLTENEWRVAQKNPDFHIFYIWSIHASEPGKLSVAEVDKLVPINKGHGRWKDILINLD